MLLHVRLGDPQLQALADTHGQHGLVQRGDKVAVAGHDLDLLNLIADYDLARLVPGHAEDWSDSHRRPAAGAWAPPPHAA